MFYRYKNYTPKIDNSVFVAENAIIVGNVEVGSKSSIWYNVVLRGDEDLIKVGSETSIQENTVCHLYEGYPLIIGNRVTVGHNAVIHGCTINDGVLIGMGSTVLDGATIGENSIIGANSLVPPGVEVPANSLFLGSPGKVVRELGDKDYDLLKLSIDAYVKKADEFQDSNTLEKLQRSDVQT